MCLSQIPARLPNDKLSFHIEVVWGVRCCCLSCNTSLQVSTWSNRVRKTLYVCMGIMLWSIVCESLLKIVLSQGLTINLIYAKTTKKPDIVDMETAVNFFMIELITKWDGKLNEIGKLNKKRSKIGLSENQVFFCLFWAKLLCFCLNPSSSLPFATPLCQHIDTSRPMSTRQFNPHAT